MESGSPPAYYCVHVSRDRDQTRYSSRFVKRGNPHATSITAWSCGGKKSGRVLGLQELQGLFARQGARGQAIEQSGCKLRGSPLLHCMAACGAVGPARGLAQRQ